VAAGRPEVATGAGGSGCAPEAITYLRDLGRKPKTDGCGRRRPEEGGFDSRIWGFPRLVLFPAYCLSLSPPVYLLV